MRKGGSERVREWAGEGVRAGPRIALSSTRQLSPLHTRVSLAPAAAPPAARTALEQPSSHTAAHAHLLQPWPKTAPAALCQGTDPALGDNSAAQQKEWSKGEARAGLVRCKGEGASQLRLTRRTPHRPPRVPSTTRTHLMRHRRAALCA